MSVKEFPILHSRYKDRPFNFYYFAKKKMALLLTVRGKTPVTGNNAYLAENATLIGDVTMGENCSVWFQAVVRGDVNFIRIGNQVNIQDGAIIHGTFEKCGTTIGNYVSIGHRAIVHGCTLHDHVLVGMGAIIMDKAVVHSNTIIAAGAVVLENTICEPNSIYAGVPAKKVKSITGNTVAGEIARISNNYVQYAAWFKNPDNPHN
jgi:carbonic anhydrase/acetyltransferase-like protein (isoleucine patch superfamily)